MTRQVREGRARTLVPAPPAAEVAAVSSFERGRGPSPGTQTPPFVWEDVVERPPPPRMRYGEGAYAVYHTIEVGADLRLSYSTIVTVGDAQKVTVDSRVGVQHRLLLEFMHRERDVMERAAARWRERVVSGLVRQRRAARRLPTRWARRAALAVVRAEGRVALGTVHRVRGVSRAVVEAPDAVYSRWLRVRGSLHDRLGRRSLWQGLKDPGKLTTEQRSVVLTLSIALLLLAVVVMNNVVAFVPSAAFAAGYRDVLNTFLLGLATAVLLPFPPSELLVVAPYLSAGAVAAFLAIVASKVVGAWFVFFVGGSLHDLVERSTKDKPRRQALVAWMTRNASRYGLWILALFVAAPFLPDTLALYVFAASGMSFRSYIVGAALGTVVRYAAVVGVLMLFGPERLHELFG